MGFDRERAFYPTVLMVIASYVIASYYVLFAAMGSNHMAVSRRTLELEIAAATVFLLLAVVGFKRSSWLVVAALAGHGVFDFVHHFFIENPGVPHWWPGFCLALDVTLAVWLAIGLGNLGPEASLLRLEVSSADLCGLVDDLPVSQIAGLEPQDCRLMLGLYRQNIATHPDFGVASSSTAT